MVHAKMLRSGADQAVLVGLRVTMKTVALECPAIVWTMALIAVLTLPQILAREMSRYSATLAQTVRAMDVSN
jgi:hypothetical protein